LQINNKELITFLMGVVEVIAIHISRECAQCSARGFVCEMCDDDKPIYAFDILNVAKCRGCNTFVHRRCTTQKRSCNRCKKLKERRLSETHGPPNPSLVAIGLMGDRQSFVSQQTQRMAAAEERRRSYSRETLPILGHYGKSDGSGHGSNNIRYDQDQGRDRGVSAGGPGEAPMLKLQ
jgi:hypothetical protein